MLIIDLRQILLLFILTFFSPNIFAKQLVFGQVGHGKVQQQAFDILQQAYQQLGISITTKSYPSKRSLSMSNRGEIDGELLRIKDITVQHPNLVAVPVTLYQAQSAAFTLHGKTEFNNITEILNHPIAIRRGILWQEKFVTSNHELVIKTQKASQQAKLLHLGRVQYIIGSVNDINFFKTIDPNLIGLKQVSPIIQNNHFIHYLHKKHRHLIPQLTVEIKKIKAASVLNH